MIPLNFHVILIVECIKCRDICTQSYHLLEIIYVFPAIVYLRTSTSLEKYKYTYIAVCIPAFLSKLKKTDHLVRSQYSLRNVQKGT